MSEAEAKASIANKLEQWREKYSTNFGDHTSPVNAIICDSSYGNTSMKEFDKIIADLRTQDRAFQEAQNLALEVLWNLRRNHYEEAQINLLALIQTLSLCAPTTLKASADKP